MDPFVVDVEDEAVYLQGLLTTAEADNSVLREQVQRRSQLLDELRTAYMKDVVMIKDRLWKHGITSDMELAALPSVDLKALLPLFSPAETVLHIRPCGTCGGTVELIRRDDALLLQSQIEAQVARAALATSQAAKAALEQAVAALTADVGVMQRMVVKEQKVNAFLNDEKKRLKGKLDAVQHRSGQLVALQDNVRALEATVAQASEEKAAVTRAWRHAQVELEDEKQAHATAVAAAHAAADAMRTEWQVKMEHMEERLVKANEVTHGLSVQVQRWEAHAVEMETQARLAHLHALNERTMQWNDEVARHQQTRDRCDMRLEEMDGQRRQMHEKLAAAWDKHRQLAGQVTAMRVERDAAIEQHATLDEAFRIKVRLLQTELATVQAELRGTTTSLRCGQLWLWLKGRAREHMYAAVCQWLRGAIAHAKAKTSVQIERYELLLDEKKAHIRHVERSMHEADARRRVDHDEMRARDDKLCGVSLALAQRTSEYNATLRKLVRTQLDMQRMSEDYDVFGTALAAHEQRHNQDGMAREEQYSRLVAAVAAVEAREQAGVAKLHRVEQMWNETKAFLAAAQRDHHGIVELMVKCQLRLERTTECLQEKTFECMGYQEEVAHAGEEMARLEQKLASEHRRATMYEEMVESLTKVVREQQDARQALEVTLQRLQAGAAKVDMRWLVVATAARAIQLLWRNAKARRHRRYKRGLQLLETDQVIADTHAARHASLRSLRMLQATQETANVLVDLGVDVSFLRTDGRDSDGQLALVQANTAASCIQNAWAWTCMRWQRRRCVDGGYARLALEQRLVQVQRRHARLSQSLVTLQVAAQQKERLVAMGVRLQPELKTGKPKPKVTQRPQSAIPGLLKYRLQHPIKPARTID
ncbi:Aste57867_23971 [Aphanomyces stellatus]|uniref:Aste57867_23971 protein n=1 Tax=Aphanomyces stellatus TaxID=120398 RepID=A0A485LPX2_9STRA|nr:hypothetical protein As57867_023898 [Aphanomyces stellatus]VFU00614.1 Aste57867_23971 [Aphanomyces stellatus]